MRHLFDIKGRLSACIYNELQLETQGFLAFLWEEDIKLETSLVSFTHYYMMFKYSYVVYPMF